VKTVVGAILPGVRIPPPPPFVFEFGPGGAGFQNCCHYEALVRASDVKGKKASWGIDGYRSCENRCSGNATGGSNPSPSAILFLDMAARFSEPLTPRVPVLVEYNQRVVRRHCGKGSLRGFENRCRRNPTGGSNPSPSAICFLSSAERRRSVLRSLGRLVGDALYPGG
jgi:hypothetical protein